MSAQAKLKLIVQDDAAEPSPFCLQWRIDKEPINYVWNDTGTAEIAVPAGRVSLAVSRGIHYDGVELEVDLAAHETATREVTLKQRFDPRAMGWYGGESHLHVMHGKEDPPARIADGGRNGAAEGLDYIQCAWGWDASFGWPPPAELNRQCREASNRWTTVGWNVEIPKGYMSPDTGGRDGNLHCFGHGWTVGLKDHSPLRVRDYRREPCYSAIQEVHRQGGVVGCAHPTRFWFNKGNFVSNWPSELPFDFVAGAAFDTIDLLNDSPLLFFQSERVWYTLLNMGYKVAGTGNTDGCLAKTRPGRYRTYTKLAGAFSWEGLVKGMRAGRNIATSGPFVIFEVDGCDPGTEFPADGQTRRATVKAWSGPMPGETLTTVQLVRNGEVVRAWDLHEQKARYWETTFELRDREFAWYCLRVLSRSRDWRSVNNWGEMLDDAAVANPVYFLPEGFQRPAPEAARIKVSVTDDAGKPVSAKVSLIDDAASLGSQQLNERGEGVVAAPATVALHITAPGYEPLVCHPLLACPALFDFCRNTGGCYPSFYSPETFVNLRKLLANLSMPVTLKRTR